MTFVAMDYKVSSIIFVKYKTNKSTFPQLTQSKANFVATHNTGKWDALAEKVRTSRIMQNRVIEIHSPP